MSRSKQRNAAVFPWHAELCRRGTPRLRTSSLSSIVQKPKRLARNEILLRHHVPFKGTPTDVSAEITPRKRNKGAGHNNAVPRGSSPRANEVKRNFDSDPWKSDHGVEIPATRAHARVCREKMCPMPTPVPFYSARSRSFLLFFFFLFGPRVS